MIVILFYCRLDLLWSWHLGSSFYGYPCRHFIFCYIRLGMKWIHWIFIETLWTVSLSSGHILLSGLWIFLLHQLPDWPKSGRHLTIGKKINQTKASKAHYDCLWTVSSALSMQAKVFLDKKLIRFQARLKCLFNGNNILFLHTKSWKQIIVFPKSSKAAWTNNIVQAFVISGVNEKYKCSFVSAAQLLRAYSPRTERSPMCSDTDLSHSHVLSHISEVRELLGYSSWK